VLNVGNMQAIQSGLYLLHDKSFEIISNIFGPPTLYGLIEHKTIRKLLNVEKCGACESTLDFCSPSEKNFYMLHTIVMHFSGVVLQLNGKNFPSSYFQFSVELSRKMIKTEILHCCRKFSIF
jgi:hypothetical protein